MTASSNPFTKPKCSHVLEQEINDVLYQIDDKLRTTEFVINPIHGNIMEGIPPGWYTIGMSSFRLPEVFVSGIAVNDERYGAVYPVLRDILLDLSASQERSRGTLHEDCAAINARLREDKLGEFLEVRPIDSQRFMYGQGQILKYYAMRNGIEESVKAVQVVWRDDNESPYPLETTVAQQVIEYVPFGVKLPKPLIEGNKNVSA